MDINEKGVPMKYIDIIKDMYDVVVINVKPCGGITSDFFYHNWIALRICIESVLICHSDR